MTERNQDVCMNCGSETRGKFCHQCGQKTDTQHRSFKRLVSDFSEEYLTLDNKLFKSLKPLFLKPGQLTVDYIAGKQKSYVLPFRLFIFSIILFIFVVSVILPALGNFLSFGGEFESQLEVIKLNKDDAEKTDEEEESASGEKEVLNENDDVRVGDLIENLMFSVQAVMIFMAPVFALMLKLLYIRTKGFYYIDHLIFSLHFHSFIFIVFSFASFFTYSVIINFIVVPVPMIYLYLAQRRVFAGKRVLTGLKTIFASILYTLLTLMTLGIVAVIKTYGLKIFTGNS